MPLYGQFKIPLLYYNFIFYIRCIETAWPAPKLPLSCLTTCQTLLCGNMCPCLAQMKFGRKVYSGLQDATYGRTNSPPPSVSGLCHLHPIHKKKKHDGCEMKAGSDPDQIAFQEKQQLDQESITHWMGSHKLRVACHFRKGTLGNLFS